VKVLGAMATWNRRDISWTSIESYLETCDPELMDLHIVDNGSTDGLADWLRLNEEKLKSKNVFCHYNSENVGTAKAINSIWKTRIPTQHCMKIDSDILWNESNWLEKMLDVFEYSQNIGIVGLKRKDVWERPDHETPFYRTKLIDITKKDDTVFTVEQASHVIGSSWLVRSTLINVIGALRQPGKYGFDDALYCLRAQIAGFACVFYPSISIEHFDSGEGGTPENAEYTRLKLAWAGRDMSEYERLRDMYQSDPSRVYEAFSVEREKDKDFSYTMYQSRDSRADLDSEGLSNLDYMSEHKT
jgi:GT2 family glycosyltransferase